MSMAQEGKLLIVQVKEGDGLIAGGGAPQDTFRRSETIVLGQTFCLTESVSRAETVVITNV